MKSSYTVLLATIVGLGVLFLALAVTRDRGISSVRQRESVFNDTPTATFSPEMQTAVASFDESHLLGFAHQQSTPDPNATSGPPPGSITALYTAAEAVTLTLETRFPSGFTPTRIETRLISYSTLMEDFMDVESGYYEELIGPVWLVGILANGLTDDDIIPRSQLPSATLSPPTSVPGGFYAWDANRTFLTAHGTLDSTGPKSMGTILSMSNESLAIATATELPSFPLTPTP